MKSQGKTLGVRIITNDKPDALAGPVARVLAQGSTPTPLAPARPARARRDPPGGPRAPVSLPPCVTPYGHSGPARGFWARTGGAANGVGGSDLPCPGQGGRARLAVGVRT